MLSTRKLAAPAARFLSHNTTSPSVIIAERLTRSYIYQKISLDDLLSKSKEGPVIFNMAHDLLHSQILLKGLDNRFSETGHAAMLVGVTPTSFDLINSTNHPFGALKLKRTILMYDPDKALINKLGLSIDSRWPAFFSVVIRPDTQHTTRTLIRYGVDTPLLDTHFNSITARLTLETTNKPPR